MSNLSWWPKAKPWILQCGILLSIGLLGWFGIRPLYQLIATKMDAIQQLDVLREYRSNEIKRLPELEKQFALIDAQAPGMDIILSKEALVGFVEQLEELAVAAGVNIEITSRDNAFLESKVTVIKDGAAKEKKDVVSPEDEGSIPPTPAQKSKTKGAQGLLEKLPLKKYIRLTLTVQGTYANLISYLHKVETMPYALEVIGLVVKEASKETQQAYVEFSAPQVAPGEISPAVLEGDTEGTVFGPVILTTDLDIVVYTKD